MEVTKKEAAVFVKMLSEATVKVGDAREYLDLLERLKVFVTAPEEAAPVMDAAPVDAPVST